MQWRTFALWNALGGISWAITIGLIAYFVGSQAKNAITSFGLFGLVAVLVAGAGGFLLHRLHRRRSGRASGEAASRAPD